MKRPVILFLLLVLASPLWSQVRVDTLYHFVFPTFRQGEVFFTGGSKRAYELNYNTLSEEMIYLDKGKPLAIRNAAIIDRILIENRTFVKGAKGFRELLYTGDDGEFYAVHRSRMAFAGKKGPYGTESHTSATVELSSVETEWGTQSLNLPPGAKVNPYMEYIWVKDGKEQRIKNMGQFNRLFREKDDQIKEYSRNNRVKFSDAVSIGALINFLKSDK